MKSPISLIAGLALLVHLSFVATADAQLLWRWFGPKTPEKNSTPKTPLPDARRVTEVNVEIAWLADPVTFPYYLEAHAAGGQLEVRGYVPDRAVREQALRIAQVHTAHKVVDSMKEHPSLKVQPKQMAPRQLQASVQSSLRVALPKQHQQLKVEVDNDGKVTVAGPVNTYDEKIAVSHSLRRLHGCTSVHNLTSLPPDLARTPAELAPRTPIVKTSNPVETKNDKPLAAQEPKSRSWLWPFGKSPAATKDEPPLLEPRKPAVEPRTTTQTVAKKPRDNDGPILIPNLPRVETPNPTPPVKNDVVNTATPAAPTKTPPLSAAELQKRIKTACPSARSVEVNFTSATELRILLEIRDEKELTPAAERIFNMPELERYRPDLQFKISGS